MDVYEAENGYVHMVYEWGFCPRLRSRWVTKAECASKRWDQRKAVCQMHRQGLGMEKCQVVVAQSWKSPQWEFRVMETPTFPVAAFRANVARRWSQFMGFIDPDLLSDIDPVNVSRNPKWTIMRRVVHPWHLRTGELA